MATLWQPFELFNLSFSTPQHGHQLEDPAGPFLDEMLEKMEVAKV
jgi:hypothetical protein